MAGEWSEQLLELDAVPELATDDLLPLAGFDEEKYGSAVEVQTQSFSTAAYVRSFADLRSISNAENDIGALPVPGETRHLLLSGAYTPFNLVHAIKNLTGQPIDELLLVTLSHSAANAVDLLSMIDAGDVRNCWLIAAHVFSKKNPELYHPLEAGLHERGQHAMVYRTHVKVFLLKMADGSKYVIEGSGNMRSCKSLEQAAIFRDDGLYDFHRGWIIGLFTAEAERRKREIDETQIDQPGDANQGTAGTADAAVR